MIWLSAEFQLKPSDRRKINKIQKYFSDKAYFSSSTQFGFLFSLTNMIWEFLRDKFQGLNAVLWAEHILKNHCWTGIATCLGWAGRNV